MPRLGSDRVTWRLTPSQGSLLGVLLGAGALSAIYMASPTVLRLWLPVALSVSATLACVRVAVGKPRPLVGVWVALTSAMVGFTLFWLLSAVLGPSKILTDLATAFYLPAGYAAWLIAPRPQSERRPLTFDVMIILSVAAVIDWQLFLRPYFYGVADRGGITSVIGPSVSLVLLPIIIRSLLSGSRMIASFSILLFAVISSLIGGLILFYLQLRGPAQPGDPADLLPMLSTYFMMAAALHPGSWLIGQAPSRQRRPAAQTLWLAPLGMTLVGLPWISAQLHVHDNLALVELAAVAMVGLVVGRCAMLASGADRLATTDVLTGLASRRAFSDRLAEAARSASGVAVLAIDLDGFNEVNDLGGHPAGDEMLVDAGRRIAAALAPEDFAARIGGDEFAVLLFSAPEADAALRTGQQIAAALNHPFRVGLVSTQASASVGVVPALPGENAEHLLAAADTAMYRAKRSGRGQVQLYSEQLDRKVRSDRAMATELAAAISSPGSPGLELYYQPILGLQSGHFVSAESLVRWRHPRLGLLAAGDFLHLIETPAQARELDTVVLNLALAQLSKWRRAGGPVTDMAVGVNLSTSTLLRPDLANLVFAGLDTYAVAPDQLILEITEHEAIPETASVEVALRSLHSAGVALWLDDFGIGYTSLHYLDRFPISVLKIDKSVVDAGTGEHPSPLLGSLVAMGQSAGVTVLAEGIETGPQAQRLTDLGFDLGQGYFMARPMPGDMVADWLQSVARSGDVIGANVVGADRSVAGVGQSTGWLQR